jgi:hypothetical protein
MDMDSVRFGQLFCKLEKRAIIWIVGFAEMDAFKRFREQLSYQLIKSVVEVKQKIMIVRFDFMLSSEII